MQRSPRVAATTAAETDLEAFPQAEGALAEAAQVADGDVRAAHCEVEMKVVRSSDPILFFSKKEEERIVSAIQEAEKKMSAEIRVHLERKAKDNILAHAKAVFEQIGMTKTEKRNGVLVFMGIRSRRFAVIGDQGIHERVPVGFWDDIVSEMAAYFQLDQFAEGLVLGISKIGEQLAEYFSHQTDDANELRDEISYS